MTLNCPFERCSWNGTSCNEYCSFELMAVGTCPDDRFVATTAGCVQAAACLDLADISSYPVTDSEYPHGCYYKKSEAELYFNADGSRTSADKDRVSICHKAPDPTPSTPEPEPEPEPELEPE